MVDPPLLFHLNVCVRIVLTVDLIGLDKISGFSIDSASLALPPKPDGSNLVGQATLPNHSLVTFALVRCPPISPIQACLRVALAH